MRKSALATTGKEFATKNISKRVIDVMVSPIKEMRILAEEYENIISFGQGIPYLDTPKVIREKLAQQLVEKDISKYTVSPGLLELREKLEKKLFAFGIKADPKKEILVTNGAIEGVFCAILTVVNPGDEVILFSPGFSSHIEQVMLAGGIPVFSNLSKKNWGIDLADVKNKISEKTKAIMISNPNNPTGTVYSKNELIDLANIAKKNSLIIISDDPYNFLVYEGEYFSIASLDEIKQQKC